MIIKVENQRQVEEELDKILPKFEHMPAIFIYEDGRREKKRLSRGMGGGFITMGKRARRWGYDITYALRYCSSIEIPDKKEQKDNKREKWLKSWINVRDRLVKSGFWKDYLDDINDGLSIGFDKITQAYSAYWDGDRREEERVQRIKEIEPRLVGITDDGREYPKTSIIWYMNTPAKVKKMYFGKYQSERILSQIEDAIEIDYSIELYGKSSYDVRFIYDSESKRAWYSEEFRGMENGHYYLALDATHAVYYERD